MAGGGGGGGGGDGSGEDLVDKYKNDCESL